MARLTAADKKLLRYPPTPQTWRCKRYVTDADGVKRHCRTVLVGMSRKCWLCGKEKPAKPELVWPDYVAACKKAGIEPGTRWRDPSDTIEQAAARRQRKGSA